MSTDSSFPSDLEPPDEVAFFGVDPETGGLLRPPKTWEEVRECVLAAFRVEEQLAQVRKARRRAAADESEHRGRPPYGVDPKKLAQAGWGVVFAAGVKPEVKAALEPLLELRREQTGRLFKVFDDDRALPPGVSAADWLHHVGPGPGVGDVEQVPYYLMLVGGPQELPFGVDFDLTGSSHAVGRLAFATPEEYGRYAKNVVAAERAPSRRRRLSLVGMEHPDDVTRSSMRHLVRPLEERFRDKKGWEVDVLKGDEATKARVAARLGGGETPSLLFFAGHGLGPGPRGRKVERIGALLCAPYPGPRECTKLLPEWYVAGSDIGPDADLRGLVAVLFGCFTTGMPSHDSFCHVPPRPLGEARMSALAARMLSHERGALAVLGHVDRAWSYSYLWCKSGKEKRSQPYAFTSVLGALTGGEGVGAAAAYLSDRYHGLVRDFLDQKLRLLEDRDFDADRFVLAWMAERDARAYLVYGDPAVRAV